MKDEDVSIETEKAEVKVKAIPVKLIASQKNAALVEWRDGSGTLKRATIPVKEVKEEVSESILDRGIPYGSPLDNYPIPGIGVRDIEDALHESGIWTVEDIRLNVGQVRAALIRLTAPILQALLEIREGR